MFRIQIQIDGKVYYLAGFCPVTGVTHYVLNEHEGTVYPIKVAQIAQMNVIDADYVSLIPA